MAIRHAPPEPRYSTFADDSRQLRRADFIDKPAEFSVLLSQETSTLHHCLQELQS